MRVNIIFERPLLLIGCHQVVHWPDGHHFSLRVEPILLPAMLVSCIHLQCSLSYESQIPLLP